MPAVNTGAVRRGLIRGRMAHIPPPSPSIVFFSRSQKTTGSFLDRRFFFRPVERPTNMRVPHRPFGDFICATTLFVVAVASLRLHIAMALFFW